MLVICPKLHMVEGRARHLAQAYVMPDPVSLTSHNTPPPSLISASLSPPFSSILSLFSLTLSWLAFPLSRSTVQHIVLAQRRHASPRL